MIGAMRKSTHTPEYAALQAFLRTARRDAGMSQRGLAADLRVPHSWIAKVESGERRIDLIEFAWFCQACGLDAPDAAHRLLKSVTPTHVRVKKRALHGGGRAR